MLIDYVDIDSLPDWLVWLDWMFYANRPSFIFFMALGFILWVIYCLVKYGIAVG